MKNTIEYEILEDGTVSVKTGEFSDTIHLQADQLMSEIEHLLGGMVKEKENPDNPGKLFFRNKRVLKGGKIQKIGG